LAGQEAPGNAKDAGKDTTMSVRVILKLFFLSVLVFAAAFALRRAFFWDVMPVSWDQEPASLWALGAAFLLRSIENVAGAVGLIALAVAAVFRFGGRPSAPAPKLGAGK
jgi:hypothetical protein